MVASALQAALASRGLDLVTEMNTSWYNAIKPRPDLVSLPHNKRALLICNTRAIWPHFTRWHKAAVTAVDHPLDTFVAEQIRDAVEEATAVLLDTYYVQDTSADRLIAFQRLAQASGLCVLNQSLHLCVHPTFGPWFAIRALLVFDEPYPTGVPLPLPPFVELDEAEVAKSVKWLALATSPGADWTMWAKSRECISLGKEHKYTQAQLTYHYVKNQSVIHHEEEEA